MKNSNSDSNNKGASKLSDGMYGFDPTGLERAAEAAKILDKSQNAKLAFELAKKEQETKQLEQKVKMQEIETHRQNAIYDHKRNQTKLEADTAKEKASYEDYLARERINYRLSKEKEARDKALQETEDSIKRQEEYRKATIKYENQLKIEYEKQKLVQEYELKFENERKNFDIVEKKIRIKEEEKRQTAREVSKIGLELIGRGIKDFLYDKHMFNKVLFGFTAAYLTVFSFKTMVSILLTPRLVKETSKFMLNNFLYNPIRTLRTYGKNKYISILNNNQRHKKVFDSIVLNKKHKEKLDMITDSILYKKQNNLFFRNYLFHGPPGCGKTLFAKQLALNSGLHYAILTGADVLPLGDKAVKELNKLFDWAEKTQKGILIFIDEGDAFLKRRENNEILSENLRGAINSFLYRTGTPSHKFMVIIGTNIPHDLDVAVLDRMDELVEFEKPNLEEREKMIEFYIKQYNSASTGLKSIFNKNKVIFSLSAEDIAKIALDTEGFSNREIAKLILYVFDMYIFYNRNILIQEKQQEKGGANFSAKYTNFQAISKAVEYYKIQRSTKETWNKINYNKRL